MFFNSDCAEKENLWGDMFIKIKKVIYIYTRRWPGEDECTNNIMDNYQCPALISKPDYFFYITGPKTGANDPPFS